MLRVSNEPLVGFCFSSRIADDVPREAVLRLVRRAWSDNRRADVTGILRIDGAALEQSVEGPCATILALAARILTDRRHGRIVIRSFAPIAGRRFAAWTVEGLVPPAADAAQAAPWGKLRLLSCADLSVASPPAARRC